MLAETSRLTRSWCSFLESKMSCVKPSKRKSYVSADVRQTRRTDSWRGQRDLRFSERCKCTCGCRRYRGETQMIVDLASEELRQSSLASGRLSNFERECKVRRYVKAQPKEAATLTSKYPEDVKPPKKFTPRRRPPNALEERCTEWDRERW